MKIILVVLLLTSVSSVRSFFRVDRDMKTPICPLKQQKMRLDENDRPLGCVLWCSPDEEEGFDVTYGLVCRVKVLPPVSPPAPLQPPPPISAEAPVPEGCAHSECLVCLDGYVRLFGQQGAQCLRQCPLGHYLLAGTCKPCQVVDCQDCRADIFGCSKCMTGYAFYKSYGNPTECVSRCPLYREKKVVDGHLTCVRRTKPDPIPEIEKPTIVPPLVSPDEEPWD